jgi:hypothetical protein
MSSSPLYPPQFTPRLLPSRINLDVNTVEGIPGVNASQRYQTPGLVLDEVDELHRLPYSMDQQDVAYKGKARECYLEWVASVYSEGAAGEVCYERYQNYPPDANLFLYGAVNLDALLDHDRRRTYQAALLNWAVQDGENFETSPPALGFADDNWRDGTQSFVFSFVSPGLAELGYGLRPPRSTSTAITSTSATRSTASTTRRKRTSAGTGSSTSPGWATRSTR